jgi:hypothetical protein
MALKRGDRTCFCNRAAVGPYTKDQCKTCWKGLNDERYKKLWNMDGNGLTEEELAKLPKRDCCGENT